MPPKTRIETGTPLEARVQRLFMCQGAFAERGLFMRAGPGYSKMVTDIDVVAHDYSLNFHHRRTYAECKGGKNRSALDRVIWVRGIKEVIAADHAYLVIDHCDSSTVRFARSQHIEILQGASLATLEDALRIPDGFWPGRCNLPAFAKVEILLRNIPPRPPAESTGAWLRQAMELWTESSALTFSYGRLNALLGILQECDHLLESPASRSDDMLAVSFAVSALLVRLSQYVLFIASDTLSMTQTERIEYLSERLVSGGLDIGQSRQILSGALQMVNAQLAVAAVEVPASWNIDSMLSPPPYTRPLATVVERVIGNGYRSAMLPLAMELRQFGYCGEESGGAALLNRARYAYDTAGLVVGFARQSIGVPEMLTQGVATMLPGLNTIHSKASQASGGHSGPSSGDSARHPQEKHSVYGEEKTVQAAADTGKQPVEQPADGDMKQKPDPAEAKADHESAETESKGS
ncbi:MAG: hypothetical protein ACLP7Q_24815 [Isosphaeraceae bacterium]